MTARAGRWLPAYLVLALIWGNSFLLIKLGLESLTPAGVVLSRLVLGAVTMLVVSAIVRSPLPPVRLWGRMFVAALLMTTIGWLLFAFAEQYISSSLAGIMNGATPLMTLVVVLVAFPEEKPTRERVIGLVIGFVGILVVVGVWQGMGTATWLGVGACVLAVTSYGISYPYVRRYLATGDERMGSMTFATALMTMGALQVAPVAAVTGYAHAPITGTVVLSMIVLGALGSGIAFLLNYVVIHRSDATTASTVTYVITVVAVISGAAFLGEDVSWNEPVGAALVIVGAATAQGLLRPPRVLSARSSGRMARP
jgi:drug/metabolite transporter (DMT)-like permease